MVLQCSKNVKDWYHFDLSWKSLCCDLTIESQHFIQTVNLLWLIASRIYEKVQITWMLYIKTTLWGIKLCKKTALGVCIPHVWSSQIHDSAVSVIPCKHPYPHNRIYDKLYSKINRIILQNDKNRCYWLLMDNIISGLDLILFQIDNLNNCVIRRYYGRIFRSDF